MANRLVGREVYEWSLVSTDGRPVDASSGLALSPTGALNKLGPVDILFVCGGINVKDAVSPALLTALRRLADRRVPLGALCTGGYALARAGLLDRFRATIHWENLSALREEFPRVRISDQLFHHRPGSLHLLGRHGAARSHAEPHPGEARSAYFSTGIRAIHRRPRAQGYGPPIHPPACPDRRLAPRADPGGAAHGGEHREAAVPGKNRQNDGSVAPSDRAAVQAGS